MKSKKLNDRFDNWVKVALQQAKKRGVELGKNGKVLAARNREEKERFRKYLFEQISDALMMTLSEIARRLKESGQLTKGSRVFAIFCGAVLLIIFVD